MKFIDNQQVYTTHGRFNTPSLSVNPGESFRVHTELCTGPWLQSTEDIWGPHQTNRKGPNPCVCVEITGAQPGEMLAVHILDIVPDNVGYTVLDEHALVPRLIGQQASDSPHSWGFHPKTVRIANGFVEWSKNLRIPLQPMIGTIGTSPSQEVLFNSRGGEHGGNMDVQEICTGTTVYLPVSVPGALLHVGDVHAIQGDGEIDHSGGIECRGTVTLQVETMPMPRNMQWVRAENEEYLIAIACCRSTDESFYAATNELIQFMTERTGMTIQDAYMLLAQVLNARCTQFVNPTRTYICKIAKKYLV